MVETVLSYRVAKVLGIRVNESSKRIKSVNNQITDVLSETEAVIVDIGDHKIKMNFIVMN